MPSLQHLLNLSQSQICLRFLLFHLSFYCQNFLPPEIRIALVLYIEMRDGFGVAFPELEVYLLHMITMLIAMSYIVAIADPNLWINHSCRKEKKISFEEHQKCTLTLAGSNLARTQTTTIMFLHNVYKAANDICWRDSKLRLLTMIKFIYWALMLSKIFAGHLPTYITNIMNL